MGKESTAGVREFELDFSIGTKSDEGSSWVLLTEKPEEYLEEVKRIIENHQGQARILLANDIDTFKQILPQLGHTQGWIEEGGVQVLITNEEALSQAGQGKGGNVLQHYIKDTYLVRTGREYNLDH